MPIKKKGDKWYWGDNGPYDSRNKAEEVQRAAYASGYGVQQKLEKIEMGAPMDGETRKETVTETQKRERQLLRKEDGGGEGFGGTAFTSTDAGIFNPTFGEKKKKKQKSGVERLHDFVTDSSPIKLSKFTATGTPGHLGPVRIDWDKRKIDEEDVQQMVEREGEQDKDTVIAQKEKDQLVEDIKDDEKEKDLQLQYGFGAQGGQADALHRANYKDELSRNPRDDEGEEEEESTIPEENDLKSEKPYDKMIRKSHETWEKMFKELLNE